MTRIWTPRPARINPVRAFHARRQQHVDRQFESGPHARQYSHRGATWRYSMSGGPHSSNNPDEAANSAPPVAPPANSDDLARVEQLLRQIRDNLDRDASDAEHKEFSLPRFCGAVAMALVVGLALWALSDCISQQWGSAHLKL